MIRHSVATAGGPVQVSKEAKRQTVITFEYMTYEYKNDHVAHESAAVSSMEAEWNVVSAGVCPRNTMQLASDGNLRIFLVVSW